jgi:RNA polymerase sigma-70 factor (ECF subfamily)
VQAPLHNEREILQAVAEGDEQAFGTLYHFYYQELYPFAFKLGGDTMGAEEILQETFIRVWLYRDRLPALDNFRAWLLKVSSIEHLTYLKKELRQQEKKDRLQSVGSAPLAEALAEQLVHVRGMKVVVATAIEAMPAQRQKIYRLSREEGKTAEEIAGELGVAKSTVHNTITSALSEIREALTAAGYALPLFVLLLLKLF